MFRWDKRLSSGCLRMSRQAQPNFSLPKKRLFNHHRPIQMTRDGKPLSELNPQEDSKPTEILFPDGKSVSIKTWKAIMVEIVRWLIENKKLNESHCAPGIGRTKKSYLVATSPKHPTGENFRNPEKIGSFYIQTHGSGKVIVQNVKHIIELRRIKTPPDSKFADGQPHMKKRSCTKLIHEGQAIAMYIAPFPTIQLTHAITHSQPERRQSNVD